MDETEKHPLNDRIQKLERDLDLLMSVLTRIAPDEVADFQARREQSVFSPTKPEPIQPTMSEPTGTPPPDGPSAPPPPPPPGGQTLARPAPSTTSAPRPLPPARPGFEIPDVMRQSEFWLKIVGIGLMLFGVVFAFKYSVEQGWINPLVRHLFGLGVGTILLVLGLRLYDKRRPFAQVLLGGGIGSFYITCFSAFQLFALISHTAAFACMIAITVAAFYMSIRQDDAIFSLIGTAGALGTPFLLYTGSGNLPGLVLYTCLVLAGTTAIYFFKGWRLLLWLSVVGGWIVMAIGVGGGDLNRAGGVDADRWAMQAGLIFAWLNFWLVPAIRRIAHLKAPDRWPAARLGIGDQALTAVAKQLIDRHLHILAIGSPLVALMLSIESWPGVQDHVFGWGAMGAAVLYALAALYLKRIESLRSLAFTHAAVGTLLFTIALWLLLEGETLLFVMAAEATTLHLMARHLSDKRIARGGHILFTLIGFVVLARLVFDNAKGPAFFNDQALVDLWAIACAVATAFIGGRPVSRRAYLVVATVSLGLLFGREFSGDLLFFLLTLETAGFYLLARKLKDDVLDALAHVAWGSMAIYLATRLADARTADLAFFHLEALLNLLPILLAVGASFWLTDTSEKRVYYFLAHLGFLAWLARELLPLENGQGFVSVAWGVYGALLLIAGLRKNLHALRLVGLGTLMLVVAKLFMVDLTRLETIWRVLLFVGFGAIFLALSYYFPRLWKVGSEEETATDRPDSSI